VNVNTELAPPPPPTHPPTRTRPPSPLRLVGGELATAPPGIDPGYFPNQGDPAVLAQLNTRTAANVNVGNLANVNVGNLAVGLGGQAFNTELAPPPTPTHPPTFPPTRTRPPSPLRLTNGELATAPPGTYPGYVANWGDPAVQAASVAQLSVNPAVGRAGLSAGLSTGLSAGLGAGSVQTESLLTSAHCGCDACTCCCVSSSCSCCGSCGHSMASMATAREQQAVLPG